MGKPGAKKNDQIVSATPGDIHIIMIPSPGGPVPTPIPHPCASMINDKVAEKVKVMGQPGAVKGSKSKHTPPHIPMGPGPFQKPPKNEGEIITGSANVFYEDKAAAMLGDTGQMCSDPSDTPVGKVMGTAAMVMVGGGSSGGEGDGSGDGQGKKAGGANPADRASTGHPVDTTTGMVIACAEDCSLDGQLPIQFTRTYMSANADKAGPLGCGWFHNYQESILRILPGHPDWEKVRDELGDSEKAAAGRSYIIYRGPLGAPVKLRDLKDGQGYSALEGNFRIARHGLTYVVLSGAFAQHHFEALPRDPDFLALVHVVDRHGNKLEFSYDEHSRLASVKDMYARLLRFKYDDVGRIVSLAVAIPVTQGSTTDRAWCTYEYDNAGDLVSMHDRGGGSMEYAYDRHLMVQDRSADGYAYFFRYDAQKRCVQVWGEDGYLTRHLRYDPVRRRTWEVNGEGESTLYSYEENKLPAAIERMGGYKLEFTYDDSGRLAERRTCGGLDGALTYNKAGLLAEFTDSKGVTSAFEYDDVGRCTRVANSDGRLVERQFDDRYNLVAERSAGHGEIKNEYDAVGRLTRRQGPAGSMRFVYDEFGHPSEIVVNPGVQLACKYDPFGRLLRASMLGRTTLYEWDDLDRLTKTTVDGQTTYEARYDPLGRLVWQRDASGWVQETFFKGHLAVEFRPWHPPDGPSRRFQKFHHDSEGRILRIEDEHGPVVKMSYNETGKLSDEEYPDGFVRRRSYTNGHRLSTIRESGGSLREFGYDGGGRITSIAFTDGFEQRREYDDGGLLVRAVHGKVGEQVETVFESNPAGMVTASSQNGWSFAARFDDTGCRLGLQVDGFAHEILYDYGANGRVSNIRYGPWEERYEYNALRRLRQRRAMNGTVESFEHDEDGRPAACIVSNAQARKLYSSKTTYDLAGRVATIEDTLRGSRQFAYDQASRLVAVDVRPAEVSPASASHARSESYQYESRARLAATNGRPLERHEVDRAGRAVSLSRDSGRCRLEYYPSGELATVRAPDGKFWRYRYDALGRRIAKLLCEDGVERSRWEYLWDGDRLLAERVIERTANEDGEEQEVVRQQHLYLHDAEVIRCRVTERGETLTPLVYHVDQTGTPDVCTNETGEVVWDRSCTPFGANFNPGDVEQNLGFPGQYWDSESGLFYNRHRYYDPTLARFIQPDPLGVGGGWDLYAYPLDPIMGTDPLGLGTRYNIPPQQGTQTVVLHNDQDLLKMESVAPNIHVFSGGSQQVAQSTGQNIPTLGLGVWTHTGVSQMAIDTHGWPGQVQIFNPDTGKNEWVDGHELGRRIAVSGFRGNRVVLIVCHAAEQDASGHSVAQDVADELKKRTGRDIEVIAASGEVVNLQNGTLIATRNVTQFPTGQVIGRMEGFGGDQFYSFSAGRPPVPAPGPSGSSMWPPAPPAPKPPGVP